MATHKFSKMIKVNRAPRGAAQIGAYSGDTRVGTIPLGSLAAPTGTKLYSFGILSDVHQNSSTTTSEYLEDLDNALEFFTADGVEFTCICGDLTQNACNDTSKLSTELDLYATTLAGVSGHAPVYPTTGNHDCPKTSDIAIDTFKSKTGITDLFTSSATYSYEVTKTHGSVTDHFLFLGMKRYNFSSGTYLDADITWLGNKLAAYKDDRCFIITHMFFPDAAGNFGQYYPTGNWLSGSQLTSLKALRAAYPRAVWFSGHSHWKWYLQKCQADANVWPTGNDRTEAFCVHISSCASPIDSNVGNPNAASTRDESIGMRQSEGAIVDVYADHIELRCYEFKGEGETSYANRLVPIASYCLPTAPDASQSGGDSGGTGGDSGGTGGDSGGTGGGDDSGSDTPVDDGMTYMTSSMVVKNAGKTGTPVQSASLADLQAYTATTAPAFYVDETTHDFTIKFTAAKQGVFVCNGGTPVGNSSGDSVTGSDMSTTSTVVLYNDGAEWDPAEPAAAAIPKVGFYGGGYVAGSSGTTTYSVESEFIGDVSKGALQLQTSSSYATNGGTFPIAITFRNFRYKVTN